MFDATEAGRLLYEEYRDRQPLSVMSGDHAPASLEQAYSIQAAFTGLRAGGAGFSGYKIAYSTPVMQQRFGADSPVFGRLMAAEVYYGSTSLVHSQYTQLEIECEVAFRLATDITEPPESVSVLSNSIESVSLAYEVVDRRPLTGAPTLLQSVATNIFGAGVVLSSPVTDWRDRPLSEAQCVLTINGNQVGSGFGRDLNGHPANPLLWLARVLIENDTPLQAGDVVITGSMIPPRPLSVGDQVQLTMDELGSLSVSVT